MKSKEIIARIKFIAADKRSRVMKEDQLEWVERKLKEINRLAKKLPGKPWQPAVQK